MLSSSPLSRQGNRGTPDCGWDLPGAAVPSQVGRSGAWLTDQAFPPRAMHIRGGDPAVGAHAFESKPCILLPPMAAGDPQHLQGLHSLHCVAGQGSRLPVDPDDPTRGSQDRRQALPAEA